MVSQMVIEFFGRALEILFNTVPDMPVPDWALDGGGAVAEIFQGASMLGAWFPFALVPPVCYTVLGCLVFGLSLRVSRIVLSLMAGGGGSAG